MVNVNELLKSDSSLDVELALGLINNRQATIIIYDLAPKWEIFKTRYFKHFNPKHYWVIEIIDSNDDRYEIGRLKK